MGAPANNDFTVKFANVNGTGSSSANGMFMKSIFRMEFINHEYTIRNSNNDK